MRNCNGGSISGKRHVWRTQTAALSALLLLAPSLVLAQGSGVPSNLPFTLNGPEAATPQELDAFGLVMEAASPSSVIAQTEAFVHQFPDSQLLSFIRLRELQAEIDANSYEGAIAIGHELLQKSPKNLEALVLMAGVLPEFPGSLSAARKANALKEAREDIQAASDLLQTFHLMENYSARDFLKYKRKLRSSLDEAAASVDLASGNYERAIQEYQAVLAENLTPSAIIYFRLGIAYYHAGEMEKARLQLEKAMQADKGIVGRQAANLLKQIPPESTGSQNPPAGVKR